MKKKQLYGEILFMNFNAATSTVLFLNSISILNKKHGSLGSIIKILPY
ncbi:hypothetical protein NT01CX_0510 [Clostridium novyi NT]|uniref:Uncharacterized protein n=1 Tax=Clostridium novyi (strain NT) TaxID=386415 RepID=A0Q2X8_CLONN|nr:hypothetical protein NT01CX_0510 [Clostridium novyi NT]